MGITNIAVLMGLVAIFPIIALGAFKKPSFGLATLVFALPFLSQARRLFIGGSMPYPSLETIAVIVLWIFVLFHDIRVNYYSKPDWALSVATFIFLLAGFLSAFFAHDSEIAFKILLTGAIAPLLCFFVAKRHVSTKEDIKLLLLGYFGLVIQVAIFSAMAFDKRQVIAPLGVDISAWLYQSANPIILFGSPSVTIAAIVGSVPLAAWYRIYGPWNNNLIWAAVSFSAIAAAIMSLSRGSWLGILVAIIASLPLYLRKNRIRAIVLVIVVLLTSYFMGYFDLFFQAIGTRLSSSINTVDIRTANYQLALRSAPQHILLGLGLGNYRYLYGEFPFALASQMEPLWFAHNLVLTLIPEIGLMGTLAFIYIIFSRLITGVRFSKKLTSTADRWLIYSLLVAIISYLIIVLTSGGHLIAILTDYLTAPALIVTLIFLGCLSGILKYSIEPNQLPDRSRLPESTEH